MARLLVILCLFNCLLNVESSRILAVFPTPSISHQLPFRQLTLELVKRGHEVVVITTDPAFKNGTGPKNLTEIDVSDVSYDLWRKTFGNTGSGKSGDITKQIRIGYEVTFACFLRQLEKPAVKELLYNSTFDLVILEAWARSTLIFSHFHKVPVIQISSFAGFFSHYETFGAPNHQLLYPLASWQKVRERSLWDKISGLFVFFLFNYEYWQFEQKETEVLRENYAPEMPDLSVLSKNVDMLFLNAHSFWDSNRPVPPNIVYIGGIHLLPPQKLPKQLESYLNSSKNGVVYVSFGTNMNPSSLPPIKIQMMVNVFSQLPYDVLWKWDKDELPGRTENIRISKWLPQPDLLKHPKVKLFITQAGLQSSDEAISAGVPLIGIPMLGDQWYNADRYEYFKIGLKLNMEILTEAAFKSAIEEVIEDPSYRNNIKKLRNLINDQPQTAIDRAVWWTEYVLRHGGAKHIRAAGAGVSWTEYLELELLLVFFLSILIIVAILISIMVYSYRLLSKLEIAKIKKH